MIFAANHIGVIDGPLLAIFAPRPVHALTKHEMFDGGSGAFLRRRARSRSTGSTPTRARADAACACSATGERSASSPRAPAAPASCDRFHHGAAYLALVTGAPVVPVTMIGTREPGGTTNSLPPRGARDRHRVRRAVHGRRSRPGRAPGNTWRGVGAAARADAVSDLDALALTGRSCPGRFRRDERGARPRAGVTGASPHDRDDAATAECRGRPGRSRSWPSSAGPTSASPPWSTGSSAAARPSSRTCPGVTRDRVSYDANWNGRAFTVVDTGGWDPDARGLAERDRAPRPRSPSTLADAVLFVVDATVGITDADEAVVKILRASGKPVVLAANKVDDQRTEAEAYGLWNLGLGEPFAGLRAARPRLAATCSTPSSRRCRSRRRSAIAELGGPRRIAIVGKPNVGKSSLLNKLAGEERVVVDNVAGTTVDPVDELVELGGRTWRFIDTAGIRKRVKEASGPRVLRLAAHDDRDRPRRGGRAGARRQRVALRAGHADPPDRSARPAGRW